MYPCVLGGLDLKSQRLQSLLFGCEISERYLECNVVNRGGGRVCPPIIGALSAVEQGEYLRVAVVAIRNLEERAVRNSGHQRQADDFLIDSYILLSDPHARAGGQPTKDPVQFTCS